MGRQPCCEKVGLKKGPWSPDEDKKLIDFILIHGIGQCCWRSLPKLAGLLRCGKSCRLRWTNYLRPDLKRGLLSEHEEKIVIDLHAKLGNRWSKIASHLPGRTDNEIKNHWNTHIKKKLKKLGIDPQTHKPISEKQDKDGEDNAKIEKCIGKVLDDPPVTLPTQPNNKSICYVNDVPSVIKTGQSLLFDLPKMTKPLSGCCSSSSCSLFEIPNFEEWDYDFSNGFGEEKFWEGDDLSNWDLPIITSVEDCMEFGISIS